MDGQPLASTPSPLPMVYVDANVLLDYIVEPDPADKRGVQYHLAAEAFFESVGRGEQRAIISDLVLMEVLGVLRKNRTKQNHIPTLVGLGRNAQTNFVIDGAKGVYEDLMTDMLKSPDYFKFMKPLTLDVTNLLMSASEILYGVRGKVRFYHSCNNCCNKRLAGQPLVCVHKCVGSMDILHALIANELNCTKLFTFDKGFAELADDYRIYPLQIEVFDPGV